MPSINSTGGIFLRLNSSGNLTVFDTTGTTIETFISGKFSAVGNTIATSVGSSTSTTSSTDISTGVGITITPQVSTSVFVIYLGVGNSDTVNAGVIASVYRTTGAIPASGSAVTGNLVANSTALSATASQKITLGVSAKDTGLTAGTLYRYYLAVAARSGVGTATMESQGAMFVMEI